MLIYAKDIQAFIHPAYWVAKEQTNTLPLNVILDAVNQHTSLSVDHISLEPEMADFAWQLQLNDGSHISLNPYTGEILLAYNERDTLYGFTLQVHRWLLWQNDQQKPLQNWVSIVATMFMFELLLGLYLWLKPKKPLKRLKIQPKARLKVLLYQLHSVLGVYCFMPLILIAFTGVAFHWQQPALSIVNLLSPGVIESRPTAPVVVPQSQLRTTLTLQNALVALPEASLFRIYMPLSATQTMRLRLQMPGETHAYSWVWSDPYSAQVLQVYDGSQASMATQVWNFRYKFHIGAFAGPVVQVFWLLLVLTASFFALSGLYLWLKRHFRK